MTKSEYKRKCERIAKKAGVVLTWIKNAEYGYYIPNTNKIFVGECKSIKTMVSIFCHELAHYKNFQDKKYYKYHKLVGKKFLRRFKTKDAVVKYALKAEIYTDKRGKKLCAKYFPEIKYYGTYKMNDKFYNMMYQKYFGGYIIIMFNQKNAFIVKNSLTDSLIYDTV